MEGGALLSAVRAVFDVVPYGVICATAGRVLFANRRAHELLGREQGTLEGQHSFLHGVLRLVALDGSRAKRPATQVIRSGKPVMNARYGLQFPTGDVRWVDMSCVPVPDGQHRLRYALKLFDEVSGAGARRSGDWLREDVLQTVLGLSLTLQHHLDAHSGGDGARAEIEYAVSILHELAGKLRLAATDLALRQEASTSR